MEAIRRLLAALDFTPLVTVHKTCEQWTLPDFETVFDHVVGAGDFVEFEFTGDAENVKDATAQLEWFIASLNVTLGEPINGLPAYPPRPRPLTTSSGTPVTNAPSNQAPLDRTTPGSADLLGCTRQLLPPAPALLADILTSWLTAPVILGW